MNWNKILFLVHHNEETRRQRGLLRRHPQRITELSAFLTSQVISLVYTRRFLRKLKSRPVFCHLKLRFFVIFSFDLFWNFHGNLPGRFPRLLSEICNFGGSFYIWFAKIEIQSARLGVFEIVTLVVLQI